MKKTQFPVLLILTVLFTGFLLGFSIGRSSSASDVIISVPASMQTQPAQIQIPTSETIPTTEAIVFPIDINNAGKEEFMALPGIGEVLTLRILAYREKNGSFSHVTELMNVEGIGQTKMETILDYVTTGG